MPHHPPHALPLEIIHEAFVKAAASDRIVALSICSVCREARAWVLPLLFADVTLTTATAILAFEHALATSAEDPISGGARSTRPLSAYVRHLWLGPTSTAKTAPPSDWPFPAISRILKSCASLRSLALIHACLPRPTELEAAVPAGVSTLYLGPRHTGFAPARMSCFRTLHSVTSLDTALPDLQLGQILASPHLRRLRRVFSWRDAGEYPVEGDRGGEGDYSLALRQLWCMGLAGGRLERLEICVHVPECTRERVAAALDNALTVQSDRRVAVRVCAAPRRDALALLYADWREELALALLVQEVVSEAVQTFV